jgi:hypothetical protein
VSIQNMHSFWAIRRKLKKGQIFQNFGGFLGILVIIGDFGKNKKPSRGIVEYIIKIVLNRKNSIQGVFKKLKLKKKLVINYLLLDYKPLNKVFNSGL